MLTAVHRRNCRTTSTAATSVVTARKCFSFYGSLFSLVLLLTLGAQQATCRPGQNDELLPPHFNDGEEFRDVDNLEIHHVQLVDGLMKADHPIIMYKEDFVDENYVPAKNSTKSQRKYKDIGHRRRHKITTPGPEVEQPENFNEAKTEKIYFDFVPETPIVVLDDGEKPKKSLIKLVPLSEELKDPNDDVTPSKDELQKRPKKYHRRVRRDAGDDKHVLRKRNPYFRHVPHSSNDVQLPSPQTHYIYVKHSVPGKKHNGLDIVVIKKPSQGQDGNTPMSFDNRIAADENDRVIFSSGTRTTSRPRPPPRRPLDESIFRDPRPENYDFSFMNQGRQESVTTTPSPIYTRRPVATRPPESIFRDPRPENYDFSFMNKGGQSSSSQPRPSPTNGPQTAAAQPAPISQCVWAIVNCCSNRNSDIRYTCFEQNGCQGAFWDLNPCAENFRDNIVGSVAELYN